ncbi:hypothetical protein GCM10023318_12790 [Nocardia callitridis]|uniref:DUF5313 domain-containing protein n=2 Tax=Nocardia callitridis TaxID=648753 RepID=A0ABP9JXG7_9NOCA
MRQRIFYDFGGQLPHELHGWVLHDLVGHGAMQRYLVRFLGPAIPFFALVLLFPGPMLLKVGLIVMMIIPLGVFTVSLSYVWRRFRLAQHGLDPSLLDHSRTSYQERDIYLLNYRQREPRRSTHGANAAK